MELLKKIDAFLCEQRLAEPKFFWMVTDITNKNFVEQLSKRKLEGVQGISDSKLIITRFLGAGAEHNTVVVLPAKETIKLNSLSQVEYTNPDYFFADGMKNLFRVFSYAESITQQLHSPFYGKFEDLVEIFDMYPDELVQALEQSRNDINSVSDYAEFLLNFAKEHNDNDHDLSRISPLRIEKLLRDEWDNLMDFYSTEGEWIVKDETLRIPHNSKLIIAVPDYGSISFNKKAKDEIVRNIREYNLDKSYQISFIDSRKFDRLRYQIRKRLQR